MMHGHEKSDLAIVAEKPANKAEQPTAEASTGASAAEPVERRAGTKGNAGQQSTCRAQNRISVSQALERIRQFAVTHPRWGAVCGKAARTVLCGGRAMKRTSLPLQLLLSCPRKRASSIHSSWVWGTPVPPRMHSSACLESGSSCGKRAHDQTLCHKRLNAFGVKRTLRARRARIELTRMTQFGHKWPLLLRCRAPDLL